MRRKNRETEALSRTHLLAKMRERCEDDNQHHSVGRGVGSRIFKLMDNHHFARRFPKLTSPFLASDSRLLVSALLDRQLSSVNLHHDHLWHEAAVPRPRHMPLSCFTSSSCSHFRFSFLLLTPSFLRLRLLFEQTELHALMFSSIVLCVFLDASYNLQST